MGTFSMTSALVWKRALNYPLFVPEEQRGLATFLVRGEIDAFVCELSRLAVLGSAGASATLGFLELCGGVTGERRVAAAQSLVQRHAAAGHAQSQYILAWCFWHNERGDDALDQMRRACAQRFAPAAFDLARFVQRGWGVRTADLVVAEKLLWKAHSIGHVSAAQFAFHMWRTGNWGILKSIVGALTYPLATVRVMIHWYFRPLSANVFFYNPHASRTLFKSSRHGTGLK